MSEIAILTQVLKDYGNEANVDPVLKEACAIAIRVIKQLESERDLALGWKVIAEINGDKMRKYLQEKEALQIELNEAYRKLNLY